MRVCHLTSVHHRDDTRIFIKEIPALANAGFEVSVVVADGKGDEQRNAYRIYDVGAARNRANRIFRHKNKVLHKALALDADVYHFHDPELIPVGLRLTGKGKKVIYDIHEDVPRSILSKDWIPLIFRKIIAWFFEKYENRAARKLHALITATPYIKQRFDAFNSTTVNINNYPIVDELDKTVSWSLKERVICYIGEITRIRGAREMVKAMNEVDGKLLLAGTYETDTFRHKLINLDSWKKVDEQGYVSRQKFADILTVAMAGLVIFYPEGNHIHAQPNKIFEYMSAGVPVIGSDFPLWKEILEVNECGICVDPMQPEKIGEAINRLLDDPELAEKMGNRGRKMVREKYNWDLEKLKLIDLYNSINKVHGS
ncbi:MAG: glycosyltransferase family 4 protein [Bacteroidota bacterium]|nr:glycosyltransferase family 4 protein [Bacteroidota bacterium]